MDVNKLVREVLSKLPEYTYEELKNLWVQCFCERAMLICSTDFKAIDELNVQRRGALEALKGLQGAVELRMASMKS